MYAHKQRPYFFNILLTEIMSPWTPQIYLFWEVNRNSIEKRQKGAHQSTHGIYNSHQKAQKGKGKQKTTPPPLKPAPTMS